MNKKIKCELYNDNFQNFKRYGIPKAQLVIADIPYNIDEIPAVAEAYNEQIREDFLALCRNAKEADDG